MKMVTQSTDRWHCYRPFRPELGLDLSACASDGGVWRQAAAQPTESILRLSVPDTSQQTFLTAPHAWGNELSACPNSAKRSSWRYGHPTPSLSSDEK
jgi:hypothetical protein